MTTPQVLILSSIYDFSTDRVAILLRQQKIPFLRLNQEHFCEYEIALDPVKKKMTVRYDQNVFAIASGTLKSIFFRQPVFLRNTPAIPLSIEEQLQRSQWSAFLRSLLVFQDVFWVNNPHATYLAESKPFQLSIAGGCGLSIPDSIISNSARFVSEVFPKEAIIKSLDTVLLREGKDSIFSYSTKIETNSVLEQELKNAPAIFQEPIDNKIDYRATVIDEKIFAVKILSLGSGISGDWRLMEQGTTELVDCQLPSEVENACFDLMKQLGLIFGGIDFVENERGFFFLEVNPTGEWGWMESETRPIGHSIAGALINGQ